MKESERNKKKKRRKNKHNTLHILSRCMTQGFKWKISSKREEKKITILYVNL